jgi:hypothetical protein
MYKDSPYKEIPPELLSRYTLDNKIPILSWWLDQSKQECYKWTDEKIESYITKFTPKNIIQNKEGKSPYGHPIALDLLHSFEKYNIKNKKVAVVGSETPWLEAILINLNNDVTTIEYNISDTNFDKLVTRDYFSYFQNNKNTYDCIVTFSSIEHSGLGRYGDPLDPDGDIETMKAIRDNLKSNGLLIWGAPVGHDALVWNVHRIYGKIRIPLLFKDFEEIEWVSCNKNKLLESPLRNNAPNPVVVLRKK